MELGYARVSTAKQDLDRQVDALTQAGIAPERIYLDKKSGATTDRPGLKAALGYARTGDVIVVYTLERTERVATANVPLAQDELLEAVDWPDGYRPPCPACTLPTSGLREQWVRRTGVREPVAAVRSWPCGCHVDDHAAALQQAAGPGPTSS